MMLSVYKTIPAKNADQGTYRHNLVSGSSSGGMKDSIHVDPQVLAQGASAVDRIHCIPRNLHDVYMRDSHRNGLHSDKANCPTEKPFFRLAQLEGARPSNLAQYVDAAVSAHQMENYMHSNMNPAQYINGSMSAERLDGAVDYEQYRPCRENYHAAPQMKMAAPQMKMAAPQMKMAAPQMKMAAPGPNQVIMERMMTTTEGYAPKKEFFTNRCNMR
jgi:hypothetical protein